MVPLINTATDVLMNNLDAHAESGAAFDFHRLIQTLSQADLTQWAFTIHGLCCDTQRMNQVAVGCHA